MNFGIVLVRYSDYGPKNRHTPFSGYDLNYQNKMSGIQVMINNFSEMNTG